MQGRRPPGSRRRLRRAREAINGTLNDNRLIRPVARARYVHDDGGVQLHLRISGMSSPVFFHASLVLIEFRLDHRPYLLDLPTSPAWEPGL
jgi:hypothetical protein